MVSTYDHLYTFRYQSRRNSGIFAFSDEEKITSILASQIASPAGARAGFERASQVCPVVAQSRQRHLIITIRPVCEVPPVVVIVGDRAVRTVPLL